MKILDKCEWSSYNVMGHVYTCPLLRIELYAFTVTPFLDEVSTIFLYRRRWPCVYPRVLPRLWCVSRQTRNSRLWELEVTQGVLWVKEWILRLQGIRTFWTGLNVSVLIFLDLFLVHIYWGSGPDLVSDMGDTRHGWYTTLHVCQCVYCCTEHGDLHVERHILQYVTK